MEMAANTGKSNLLSLSLLILVFALPPLAGWIYYFNPQWLPSGRSNHGLLIHPPRPLQEIKLQRPDGSRFDWRDYEHYWKLAILTRGQCGTACREQLARTHQVLRAIGAARNMVKQLLILLPDSDAEPPAEATVAGVTALRMTADSATAATRIFELDKVDPERAIYLVAPDNALMMRHDLPATTSEQILQDLETLLKASQNWVKGN